MSNAMKNQDVKKNEDTQTHAPIEDADLKKIRGGATATAPEPPRPLPSTHVCRHDPIVEGPF